MRRSDREVHDAQKIDDIILKSKICRIGFYDNGEVYIVPLNFGYTKENGKRIFYFHGAKEGRKASLISQKPMVGFELDTAFTLCTAENACDFSAKYQSVIGNGRISIIEDEAARVKALEKIMFTNTGKEDWGFPPAMLKAVHVFKLEVTSISCKEHIKLPNA